jgi:hypothetical protein
MFLCLEKKEKPRLLVRAGGATFVANATSCRSVLQLVHPTRFSTY